MSEPVGRLKDRFYFARLSIYSEHRHWDLRIEAVVHHHFFALGESQRFAVRTQHLCGLPILADPRLPRAGTAGTV